jgi:hypothetical protein
MTEGPVSFETGPFHQIPPSVQKGAFTHFAFADESCPMRGRFRSVAVVSMPAYCALEVEASIRASAIRAGLYKREKVREVKWEKVRSAHAETLALALIEPSIELCKAGLMRLDILSWDMHDSRNSVTD